MRCAVLAVAVSLAASPAKGQVDEIVSARLERHTIAALVTRLDGAKTFKHGIAIFPGHPGILKLHEENGQPEYDQRGNFLVRSRRHWLDDETLTAGVGGPSRPGAGLPHEVPGPPRHAPAN